VSKTVSVGPNSRVFIDGASATGDILRIFKHPQQTGGLFIFNNDGTTGFIDNGYKWLANNKGEITSTSLSSPTIKTDGSIKLGNWNMYSQKNTSNNVVGFNWSGKNKGAADEIFRIDSPGTAKFEIDTTGLFGTPSVWGNKGFF
jgi:hypothetical protein